MTKGSSTSATKKTEIRLAKRQKKRALRKSLYANLSPDTVDTSTNDEREALPGFIFMCNGKTRPDCYRYHVFGLPAGEMGYIENVKTGTRLFLFDIDTKLLYGVYKASCNAQLNLEQAAFGGKFPAQVRFEIIKECFPLPECAFKHCIRDNYLFGPKFEPELTKRQVKKLRLLFRPIPVPSSTPVAPPSQKIVPPQENPALVREDQFQPPARLAPPEGPYAGGSHFGHAPWLLESRHVHPAGAPTLNDHYTAAAHLLHTQLAVEPWHVPSIGLPPHSDPYYSAEPRRAYLPGNLVLPMESRHVYPVGLPPHSDPYYSAEAHRAYFPENPALPMEPRHVQPVGLPPHSDPYFSAEAHRAYFPEHPILPMEPRLVQPVGLPSHSDPYYFAAAHRTFFPENSVHHMEPHHFQPGPVGLLPHSDPIAEAHRAYFAENPVLPMQDPYSRFRTAPEMVPRDQFPGMENGYQRSLLERGREIAPRTDNAVDYYSHHLTLAASHAPVPSNAPVQLPANVPVPSIRSFGEAVAGYR